MPAQLLGVAHDCLMDRGHCREPGGLQVAQCAEEALRRESAFADDARASRDRGEQVADQAMHVEQRHHVEAPVACIERERGCDRSSRGKQVGMGKRHELGSRRRARGVQHQGDIAGRGVDRTRVRCDAAAGRVGREFDPHAAGGPVGVSDEFDQCKTEIAHHLPRGRWIPTRDHHELHARILQEESQLIGLQLRIQRHAGSATRDREKRHGRLRSVGVDQRHARGRHHPCVRQRKRNRLDVRSKRLVAQRCARAIQYRGVLRKLSGVITDKRGDGHCQSSCGAMTRTSRKNERR